MFVKLLITILLLHNTLSYIIGLCEPIGSEITSQVFTDYVKYYPVMKINLYSKNVTILNTEMRMYDSKRESYTSSENSANKWINKFELNTNYTCYYTDDKNIFYKFYINSTDSILINILFLFGSLCIVVIGCGSFIIIIGMCSLQIMDWIKKKYVFKFIQDDSYSII